jgi:polysaccharide biosynthesis transport protein
MNETVMGLPARRHANGSATPAVPAYPPPAEEPEANAFGDFVDMLLRRARLIGAVFLVVLAAGVIVTLMQAPKYSATALLVINPNPDQVVPEKQSLASPQGGVGVVDSEIEVLKSPALAARLAHQIGLDKDPKWNGEIGRAPEPTTEPAPIRAVEPDQPGPVQPPVTPVKLPVNLNARSGAEGEATPPPPAVKVPDSVVTAVSDAIDVRRRGLSFVIEVSAEAESPARAAQMANGLSNIYLESLVETRYGVSERANAWLEERLGELRAEVQRKQAAAQSYRAQQNLLTAEGVSLVEQQLAQIQSSLLTTRAEFAQKQAEYNRLASFVKNGQTVAPSGSMGVNDSMRDLRDKESALSQRIADLENRYGPQHPDLIQAKEEKAALDLRIKEEMERVANRSKMEVDSLGARLSTQEEDLGRLRGELVAGNFDQVRLNELQTDADAARSVYESFLQRYHEVASQGTLASVDARLLSLARPPAGPSSPHILLNAALTLAAAMGLALLAALIAEQFRGAIESTEDIEQRVGVRALVAIPALTGHDLRRIPQRDRNPAGYLLTKRMSPFAEALRVLHTSILLSNHSQDKVIALTSAMPGEGKTTLSLGLARVAAMGGQNVIVVDCDIRMRSINKMLGIEPQVGLQHVLAGEVPWKDVVGSDAASGAHVLPAAGAANTSRDVFGSGALEKLITELAEYYDLVVLDCAPIFAVADTRLIASLADAVIVTARAHKTPARALAAGVQQLEISGARVLGVALNRVDTRKGRRSFYDGLYYSKAFRGYYAKEA